MRSLGVTIAVLAATAAALVTASTAWQRMEGIDSACATVFEEHKTELSGQHWGWTPPGWVCEFGEGDEYREERLPFGRR